MKRKNDGYDIGAVLAGRYRLEAEIGSGGMGVVYRATQVELGRFVALKLVHPKHAEDSAVVERFQREAQAAATIGHDNICEVIDIGRTEDGTPFLVMPLLKGAPLSQLASERPLPLPTVVDIICQTLGALQAAHDAGIVHRDLKPANVFVTRVGDRDNFVKLLDFGISKFVSGEPMDALTQTGVVLGTPHYMCPEQAKGERRIDHRVDIYAVGVILYELLTGRLPFTGESYNEVMFRILTEPFDPPSDLRPDLPLAVERVVLRAMAKDPTERYESAAKMGEALAKAARLDENPRGWHEPGDSRGDGDGQGPRSFPRFDTLETDEFTPAEVADAVPPSARRSRGRLVAVSIVLVIAAAGALAITLIDDDSSVENVVPAPVVSDEVLAPLSIESSGDGETLISTDNQEERKAEAETVAEPEKPEEGRVQQSDRSTADRAEKETASKGSKVRKKHSTRRRQRPVRKPEKNNEMREIEGRFGTTIILDEN